VAVLVCAFAVGVAYEFDGSCIDSTRYVGLCIYLTFVIVLQLKVLAITEYLVCVNIGWTKIEFGSAW
jgi:hypothetical protein